MRYRFLRFPDGKEKALTLSYDDGVRPDKKLIEIADQYGIKVTLNINSGMMGKSQADFRLTAQELKELAASGGHEIAVHGDMHIALGKASAINGIRDVLQCREELEREFGGIIRGMAYPDSGITHMTAGVTKTEIKTYLKQLGIAYARTLGGDNNYFDLPEDFLEWMPTAHHQNPELMHWLEQFLSYEMPGYAAARPAKLFYLWGHSYEYEGNHNWDLFEDFCKTAGGHDNIWYATNIEICDYVAAYRALQFSVDNTKVFNPTCQTVWFEMDTKLFCSPAGKLTNLVI